MLFIIRENKDKLSHSIVGECSVDGFMNGEASAVLRGRTVQEEVFIVV